MDTLRPVVDTLHRPLSVQTGHTSVQAPCFAISSISFLTCPSVVLTQPSSAVLAVAWAHVPAGLSDGEV